MVRSFTVAALELMTFVAVSASSAEFVPNELIVTFAPGTPAARAVERAKTDTGKADVAPLERQLADVAGPKAPPLRVGRLMSGRALLVRIDADAMARRLLESVQRKPWVAEARLAPATEREGSPRVEARVKPDSPAHAALAEGSSAATWLRDLERDLEREVEMPVRVEHAGGAELLVIGDWTALTEATKSRLSKQPDVESVDLNVMMKHYEPSLAR